MASGPETTAEAPAWLDQAAAELDAHLVVWDRCCAEGFDAYMAGEPRSACPYQPGSLEADAWKGGYDG